MSCLDEGFWCWLLKWRLAELGLQPGILCRQGCSSTEIAACCSSLLSLLDLQVVHLAAELGVGRLLLLSTDAQDSHLIIQSLQHRFLSAAHQYQQSAARLTEQAKCLLTSTSLLSWRLWRTTSSYSQAN